MKKFLVQTKSGEQPDIRIDASSIEKAREIAERVFGSIIDIYQLKDFVESPAMFVEERFNADFDRVFAGA